MKKKGYFSRIVNAKINSYKNGGYFNDTTTSIFDLFYEKTDKLIHKTNRIAVFSDLVARELKMDYKSVFFAGLVSGIGGLFFSPEQDDCNISKLKHEDIQKKAINGFNILSHQSGSLAYFAGFHLFLAEEGYGKNREFFPEAWPLTSIKNILDVSKIVLICEAVDVYMVNDKLGISDLKKILTKKHEIEKDIVKIILENVEYFYR